MDRALVSRAQQLVELKFVPTSSYKEDDAELEEDASSSPSKAVAGTRPMNRQTSSAKHQTTFLNVAWSVIAYMAGLLVMHLLCSQTPKIILERGVVNRRLAVGGEREDEEEEPASPGLENVCLELGHWLPIESPSGEPRASPLMVEEFFKALEGQGDESDDVGVSQGDEGKGRGRMGAKRLPPGGDDDEQAGPSQKIPRTESLAYLSGLSLQRLLETALLPTFGRGEAGGSGSSQPSTSGLAGQGTSSAPSATDKGPGVMSGLADDGEQPSTSRDSSGLAVAPGSTGGATPVHPYVRTATLGPGVIPRPFSVSALKPQIRPRVFLVPLLRRVQEILLQPVINQKQADALVSLEEDLASYVANNMASDVSALRPYRGAGVLGRRVLVLDSLYRIARTLGSHMNMSWWQEAVQNVSTRYVHRHDFRAAQSDALANELIQTLEKYKRGLFPSDQEMINLKRKLFFSKDTSCEFRRRHWDPWREDDDETTGR